MIPDSGGSMGATIEEKFLNNAIQAYGNEAAAVSETVATGISSFTDPRGITAVADAYEGYFPQAQNATKATISGLSAEGAFPSPAEFFQNQVPSGEVSKSFNDPTFNAVKELPSFLKNIFGKGGIPNGFAEAGIVIINSLGGPDTNQGVTIKLPQDVPKMQTLMKMQSTLKNQQSMSQDLALPVYSNLRA